MAHPIMTREQFGVVYARNNLRTFGYSYVNKHIEILVDWPYFLDSLEKHNIIPKINLNTLTMFSNEARFNSEAHENVWLLELVDAINQMYDVDLDVNKISYNCGVSTHYVACDVESFGAFIIERMEIIDEQNKNTAKSMAKYDRMVNCRTREEWNELPPEVRRRYEKGKMIIKPAGPLTKIVNL